MNIAHYLMAGFFVAAVTGCDSGPAADIGGTEGQAESAESQIMQIHPEIWPKQEPPIARDENTDPANSVL